MEKPQTTRVQLIARVAPEDREMIVGRAERECRSIGEVLAVMLRENELLQALKQHRAEAL